MLLSLLQGMALYRRVRSRGCLEISSVTCAKEMPRDVSSRSTQCGLLLFLPCMKYRSPLYIVESKEKRKPWTSHHFADEGRGISFDNLLERSMLTSLAHLAEISATCHLFIHDDEEVVGRLEG